MNRSLARLLALVLCLSLAPAVRADDLGNGSWSEVDTANVAASPNGWPAGITGTGTINTGRAMMGAVKRFWDRMNPTVTSTGSANAYVYTPTSATFPTALTTGECYSWKANFANTSTATLAVNSLAAKNLFKQSAAGPLALSGGEIQINQLVTSCYDGTQFQITSALATAQTGLVFLSSQTASASARISFTGLTTQYDRYVIKMDSVQPATDNASALLEVSDDNGANWKTGANTYAWALSGPNDAGSIVTGAGPVGTNIPILGANLANTNYLMGDIEISQFMTTGLNTNHFIRSDIVQVPYGGTLARWSGSGRYYGTSTALNAISFRFSSGNIAVGKFSLYGYRNG